MRTQNAHADDHQVIQKHLNVLRRRNIREDSLKGRRGALLRLARKLPGRLLEATAVDLDTWQSEITLTVCMSSLQTYTCHVRGFYRWAWEAELIPDDPAAKLPVPVLPPRLPRPIPEAETELAMRCSTEPVKTWLALAGWTGLRAGEISRIQRESLEPAGTGAFLNVDGKGGKQRLVPVSPEVFEMLKPYLHTRGPIFRRSWSTNRPVTPNDVTTLCSKFLHGLGLPYTLHTLRHRFATQLAEQTHDLRMVQELIGHTNLGTTAGYVAFNARRGAAAVAELAATLPKAS